MKNTHRILFLLILFVSISTAFSQPSGGPYGPIPHNYPIPAKCGTVYFVSSQGDKSISISSLIKPTTIENAVSKAKTGDVIVLRGGTYRTGNMVLNQGITIQACNEEQPVLKGTFIAKDWKSLNNGLWTTKWEHLFPGKPWPWWERDQAGKGTPMYLFNHDMVFVDGKYLKTVGREGEVDENSFYIDYETHLVYIGTDPANKLVEITAFDNAMVRKTVECNGMLADKKGLKLKGIIFCQYANMALAIEGTDPQHISPGSEHGKEVVGSLLENCSFDYCSRGGAYLLGDSLIVRHCKISNTGTEGLMVIASSDVLIEKNIFTANNIEQLQGVYPAALKIFNQTHRVVCRDNLIMDIPYSNGVWYDVGNVDGIFVNNWVENVGVSHHKKAGDNPWGNQNGLMFEISKGVTCAGNVFLNCDNGVFVLNSCNAQIYQNTFVNSILCIGRDKRTAEGDHFGWHPGSGPAFDKREGHLCINNVFYGDETFNRPLIISWQPKEVAEKLKDPQFKQLDYNVFVNSNFYPTAPILHIDPTGNTKSKPDLFEIADLQKTAVETTGTNQYFSNYLNSPFKSMVLKNFELIPEFKPAINAGNLPENIKIVLRPSKNKQNYFGAYSPGNIVRK